MQDDDETQAFHYHHESYRFFPVNLDVISWLGVWYVKSELYEKAIEFFERAAEIQPTEVKWKLMVTSCYRRMGAFQKAMELYEDIHAKYPDNLECKRVPLFPYPSCHHLGLSPPQASATWSRSARTWGTRTSSIKRSWSVWSERLPKWVVPPRARRRPQPLHPPALMVAAVVEAATGHR